MNTLFKFLALVFLSSNILFSQNIKITDIKGTIVTINSSFIGLGNVDNTSDLNKPISNAVQTALDNKQNTLFGTGFVKSSGGSVFYDNTNYLSSISFSNVITALGYTPYNSTNPSGYITGLNWAGLSSKPITLAGFGITDAYPLIGNPSGFITGITSVQVTGALGFTPYNSTNPNGYITSTGSISGSAGSVAWANVLGRPTSVSNFSNDSGYVATAGARAALSFTPGSGAYNSTTGVITIPTNTNQLTNGAGFITGSYLPLSGGTVSGTITATAFYASSDRRLKNIVSRSGDMIEFTWKDKRDNKTHFGYVAQEVRKKMPEQVNRDEQGYMSVNYIEVLVAKVNALELEVQSLKEKLK